MNKKEKKIKKITKNQKISDIEKEQKIRKKILKILSNVLFGRLVMCFALLALQIVVVLLLTLRFSVRISYYLTASILATTLFMIYLVNKKGKNEFKLAWLMPMILFPFFTIIAYVIYQIDYGGIKFKKRIVEEKKETDKFLPPFEQTKSSFEKYEKIKDLAYYLDNCGDYPSYENSQITYFPNGEMFFPVFLEELKKAKKFIFIEYFIIKFDESWNQIFEILKQKASEGVEVRVLFDALGSVTSASSAYVSALKKYGIKAQIFSPISPFFSIHYNNRDHRKIVVIDGKCSFTGGLNLSNEYFNIGKNKFKYWKDSACRICGKAIESFTVMFLHTWNIGLKKNNEAYQKYIKVDYDFYEENGLVCPYGDHAFNNEDVAENVYLWIINNAKKYVHITSPYLILDNRLLNALIFASHRGIDVSIIVPGKPDHFVTFAIGKTFIKNLVSNGVKVYLYKDDSFIHAKNFVSDDITATVGSVNLDYRSLYHHFECGVLLHENKEVLKIEQDFQNTIKESTLLEKDFYKKLPLMTKIVGELFRVMAPLF